MNSPMLLWLLLLTIVSFTLASGCSNDVVYIEKKLSEKDILLTVETPSPTLTASSEDGTVEFEKEVGSIVVLLFDQEGRLSQDPIYGGQLKDDPEDTKRKTFTVRLPLGLYDVVVLANSNEILNPLLSSFKVGVDQKEELLSRLVVELPNGGWSTDVSDPKKAYLIPMWGEKQRVEIEERTNKLSLINLHRMMARVNISVLEENESTKDFRITQLKFYNSRNKGCVVPAKDNWDYSADSGRGRAAAPTAVGEPTVEPLDYSWALSEDGKSCLYKIYLFESPAATGEADPNAPCLLMKGEYKGREGWYRVDLFIDKYLDILRNYSYDVKIKEVKGYGVETEEEALSRRGVNLEVEVVNWGEYELGDVVFDKDHFISINPSDIVLDRLEQLENKVVVKTDKEAGRPTIKAVSKYGDENSPSPQWLKNYKLSEKRVENNLNLYDLSFDVEENTTEGERVGYLLVKVGRLTNIVRVTQQSEVKLMLEIFEEVEENVWEEVPSMRFVQTIDQQVVDSKRYKIRWSPASSEVKLQLSTSGINSNSIVWEPGSSPLEGVDDGVLTNPDGEAIFSVQPSPYDSYVRGSFVGRESILNGHITYHGKTKMKMILFEQIVSDVYVEGSVNIMDGESGHYVTIKANVPWAVDVTKNVGRACDNPQSHGVVEDWPIMLGDGTLEVPSVKEGVYNLPEGTKLYFRTVNDLSQPHIFSGFVGFRVRAKDVRVEPYEDEFMCASGIPQDGIEANCYVLDPTEGCGILIPVKAANGVMIDRYNPLDEKLYVPGVSMFESPVVGGGREFGARLVWTDTPGTDSKGKKVGLAKDGLLEVVMAAGKDEEGYVLVLPGNQGKVGNAVVALTSNADGTGEILWSWHIWVTDEFAFDSDVKMMGRIVGGEGKHPAGEEVDHMGRVGYNAENWLDRNVGAISNTPNSVGSMGNYYQWGRKDPFPGSSSMTATGSKKQLYDANGPIVAPADQAKNVSVAESIKTPSTFYVLSNNWVGGTEGGDIGLWGVIGSAHNKEGDDYGKSIFDPCPAGWRVPVRELRSYSDNDGKKYWGMERKDQIPTDEMARLMKWYIVDKKGFFWGLNEPEFIYKGGHLPLAGDRRNGGYANLGSRGHYWSASQRFNTATNKSAFYLYMDFEQVIPSNDLYRSYAYPIRCVRE